jgi:hypothetical protein
VSGGYASVPNVLDSFMLVACCNSNGCLDSQHASNKNDQKGVEALQHTRITQLQSDEPIVQSRWKKQESKQEVAEKRKAAGGVGRIHAPL